jgi:hypothetical protein
MLMPSCEADRALEKAARLVATLERNVVRLGEVAGKLERLARLTRSVDNTPTEQSVDLGGMAAEVAHQLADMASARDVAFRSTRTCPS